MSGYIKYFGNGGKNMSFMSKMIACWINIMKFGTKLNTKFHSMPVYDKKNIKAKEGKFNVVIKTNFWGDEIPKEDGHRICIACISIDSVMKMDEKISKRLLRRMQV